jgi:hypothetical protein
MWAVVRCYTAIVHLYVRTRTCQQTTQESTNVSQGKQDNLLILWNPKTCHFSSNSPLSNLTLNKFKKDTITTTYLPVLQAWTCGCMHAHAHTHTYWGNTSTSCTNTHPYIGVTRLTSWSLFNNTHCIEVVHFLSQQTMYKFSALRFQCA